ncbi:hypothetical protein PUN28_019156 [Cardiocondyla obscurior]|uniref:Uncharacterized protein n=1 Tax=Cardiocondyla obscurior TaxID=286306 RepID=A0AAW2EHU1_9HYME
MLNQLADALSKPSTAKHGQRRGAPFASRDKCASLTVLNFPARNATVSFGQFSLWECIWSWLKKEELTKKRLRIRVQAVSRLEVRLRCFASSRLSRSRVRSSSATPDGIHADQGGKSIDRIEIKQGGTCDFLISRSEKRLLLYQTLHHGSARCHSSTVDFLRWKHAEGIDQRILDRMQKVKEG